jgi:hypothetical protein
MATDVSVPFVSARILAAVRWSIRLDQIADSWRPALDLVWAFLQQHPGLRTDGHNIFLYHHPANMQSPMDVDFGVQVIRPFGRAAKCFRPRRLPGASIPAAVYASERPQVWQKRDAAGEY